MITWSGVTRLREKWPPLRLPPLEESSAVSATQWARLPYASNGFGKRIVELQLDSATTQGSRPGPHYTAQLEWLRARVPRQCFNRVFHPMCGPGVVALAGLNIFRRYLGLDVNRHAIQHAESMAWPKEFFFETADCMTALSQNSTLVLLMYESVNLFPPDELRGLLKILRVSSTSGAALFAEIRNAESQLSPKRWIEEYPSGGLFSSRPHALAIEQGTLADGTAEGHRFTVVPGESDVAPRVYHSLVWRYGRSQLSKLLGGAGYALTDLAQPLRLGNGEIGTPMLASAT